MPLLFHHGTPGSGALNERLVDAAADRGLRWVAPTRPGYGRSPRRPGRTVADCAADAEAILDALGAPQALVVGWSGGGPHALACGALLPERVAGVAIVAGVAPADTEGLDWTAGMGPENIAEFAAARAGSEDLTAFLDEARAMLASIEAEGLADAFGGLAPEVDRAVVDGAFAVWIAEMFRDALRPGIGGWLDDDLSFVRPWGFVPERLGVPAAIWQGDADTMVPLAHGRWLADAIATATLRLEPGEGHLSLVARRFDAILDDLVSSAEAR